MAEGALEVEEMSGMELSGGVGGGGVARERELAAQMDGPLELHVDSAHREMELVEETGALQAGELEGDGMVTEPVLGMRMLMSSRVSAGASSKQGSVGFRATCVCMQMPRAHLRSRPVYVYVCTYVCVCACASLIV